MRLADLGSSSNVGSNHSIKKYWNIFFIPFTLMRIKRLIPIIAGNFPPSDIGAARIGQTQGPFCTVQLFGAGSLGHAKCKGVQRVYCFRTKCSTEVIAWTPSLFGRRASITELSLYHLRQCGYCTQAMALACSSVAPVLGFCYDRHWFPSPSPLIVPSFQP
jgi:hypothetical protein